MKKIDGYGNIFWYKEETNIRHREDGPAIEYTNGTKYWYKEDKFHRKDGPAVEYFNSKIKNKYYLNGKYLENIKNDSELIIKLLLG